jgi:hypothetical protein
MTKYVIVFVDDGRFGDMLAIGQKSQLVEHLYASKDDVLKSSFFSGDHPWEGCYHLFEWDDVTNEIRWVEI